MRSLVEYPVMSRARADALLGGADGLLDEPRQYVRTERLGEPGDVLDGEIDGRLVAVELVPIAHVDLPPDERERLCHALDGRRRVYVHYVE